MDIKMKAVLAYASQFYDPKAKNRNTYNSKNFTDSIHYRARDLGRLIGVEFAEGFTIRALLAVEI